MLISWCRMRIAVKKFRSGERYVFLLGDDGVPDFWVAHFVTQKLRMSNTATTIEQYLKSIKHLKLWETIKGRNLIEEIYDGKVPSHDDLSDLREHCVYQVKAFKEKPSSNVVNMGQFYQSKSEDKPTIRKTQYITRIAHIAEFLHFIGMERVKNQPPAASFCGLGERGVIN